MKAITLFPRVWTGAGRVVRKFFLRAVEIVVGKEGIGPPGGSVAQQLTRGDSGGTQGWSLPARDLWRQGHRSTTQKGKRAREFSGLTDIHEGVYVSR